MRFVAFPAYAIAPEKSFNPRSSLCLYETHYQAKNKQEAGKKKNQKYGSKRASAKAAFRGKIDAAGR